MSGNNILGHGDQLLRSLRDSQQPNSEETSSSETTQESQTSHEMSTGQEPYTQRWNSDFSPSEAPFRQEPLVTKLWGKGNHFMISYSNPQIRPEHVGINVGAFQETLEIHANWVQNTMLLTILDEDNNPQKDKDIKFGKHSQRIREAFLHDTRVVRDQHGPGLEYSLAMVDIRYGKGHHINRPALLLIYGPDPAQKNGHPRHNPFLLHLINEAVEVVEEGIVDELWVFHTVPFEMKHKTWIPIDKKDTIKLGFTAYQYFEYITKKQPQGSHRLSPATTEESDSEPRTRRYIPL
ncbi:hypothetical protein F4778DRAFT_738341 [Xylariomycetidae sp. FL2044]|nr:hypothetical protein F4778DRAFT_738341 [Xylariomycetidae sp. FL2044]